MTEAANQCVEALRWSHYHDDCTDENDTCPVKDECLRCDSVLCNVRIAADLIESLSAQLEQVTRERDAAIRDIDEAAPCFACIRFERNGGDCIGAHVCIDDILQDALGGKYADYYWQWRGAEANQ